MLTSTGLLVVLLGEVVSVARRLEFESQVGQLTSEVIGEEFSRFRCVTYVLDEGVEMGLRHEVPVLVIRVPAEKEVLRESFEQGCGGYVVRVGKKSEMARGLIAAKRSAMGFRYNNQRYLFLPTDEADVEVELLKEADMFFLPNLVLVTPENGSLSVATHTVFDHHKHDLLGVVEETVDRWDPGAGFRFGRELYPDKLASLNGKKFVFAVTNYSPFSLVQRQGNRTVFDGFETRIAAEFVELVNGTWEGLDHPVELWGNSFPNGTGTGIVGSVMGHRADFGFSAIYQWFCEECDCTYPFYQSGVTCLVPRPKPLSGWLTIILPFTPDTWLALIVTYLLTSTFLLALHLALRHMAGLTLADRFATAISDSFFINFRLQLEQVPDVRKTKTPLSVYVKISVYYYFFVAAFWQGGISSILTVPRFENPINTVPDLIRMWPTLQWGANSDAWVFSIKASSDPNLIQIVNKFSTLDDDTLLKKTKTQDFAFFVEELPHGHFGYNDYINEESMRYLRLMESKIYTAFGVLIQPKGSPYSQKFDETVLRLFDTGIVHKIEVQVSLERINNRLQNMIRASNLKDTTTVTLAVKHIQGPLFIFAAGIATALLAFLLELLHSRRHAHIPPKPSSPPTAHSLSLLPTTPNTLSPPPIATPDNHPLPFHSPKLLTHPSLCAEEALLRRPYRTSSRRRTKRSHSRDIDM